MPSNIEKISPQLEIRHKSSMVYGVRRCISHDILDLLIICQMSKCQTPWLWRKFEKKRTWHNEVQTLWGQIWPHMWTSPKHLENIFYEHFVVFWWSSNLTLKLTSSYLSLIMSSFFFVNLLHRPGVWRFDIWQIISLMSDLVSDPMLDLVSDLVFHQIFILFNIFKILLFNIF